MGDELNQPRYRRTPEPERREPPGRLPSGRRLVVVVVGLVILAVLAVVLTLVGDDDAGSDRATPPSTTAAPSGPGSSTPSSPGRAPDAVVARQVLPASLGPGWVDVSREPEPVPAEVDPGDPCAAAGQPIADGLVTRAFMDHLGTQSVVEKAALVGGVVTEGTPVPRLDDQVVVDCLQEGLAPEVAEGNELVVVDQDLPAAPEGAELSGVRFEVHRPDGEVTGRFELLLLRRDRAVTFALVAVLDVASATPVADLVAALDAPLAAAAARLN